MAGGTAFDFRADGSIHIRPQDALPAYPARLTDRLIEWAARAPDRCFVAQRDASGAWRRISYAEALQRVRGIATALLGKQLSAERPVAILTGNDIEHLLLG